MNYVSSRLDRIDIVNIIFSATQPQFIETLEDNSVATDYQKIQIFNLHIFLTVR